MESGWTFIVCYGLNFNTLSFNNVMKSVNQNCTVVIGTLSSL